MLPPTELPATAIRVPSAPSSASVRGDPLQCRIALLELGRKFRLRQRSVFDKHADLSRTDDEIAQQALMVLKIADDPDAAMNEEQHARITAHLLGLHDV